jgi:hypothetical protein
VAEYYKWFCTTASGRVLCVLLSTTASDKVLLGVNYYCEWPSTVSGFVLLRVAEYFVCYFVSLRVTEYCQK